jgi:hypothetical protein
MTTEIIQRCEFPETLEWLVEHCTYRSGWEVNLYEDYVRGQGSTGTTLVITTDTVNSYRQSEQMHVNHLFIVPAAAYDERSWRRWLFECFHQVELHECMEFFTINGTKPYAPSHGPGNDPYMVRETGTEIDARTSFRGELNE